MQITITLEELMKLQQSLSQKDIEIALLNREVEELRNKEGSPGDAHADGNFITLNLDNVCKVLSELKGRPDLVAFLYFVLQKMMPEGMPVLALQRMLAAASLENAPANIVAAGDVNVHGTYNNVHGNDNVNF